MIFPDYVNQALKESMDYFDKKIHGFGNDDSIVAGVESRTSSPVRIERDENFVSNIGTQKKLLIVRIKLPLITNLFIISLFIFLKLHKRKAKQNIAAIKVEILCVSNNPVAPIIR